MDYYQITFSLAVTGDSFALFNSERDCVKYSCYFHREKALPLWFLKISSHKLSKTDFECKRLAKNLLATIERVNVGIRQ